MEIKGSYQLPCDPDRAWAALNDPHLLKACLKGCERLEKTADDTFEGTVRAKVGPVQAKFDGTMMQTAVDPPNTCTMVFEGKGGVAGFAKGSANVILDPVDGGTLLTYDADAKIGGKLAQMGARLVEGTARSMAEDFFGKFSAALASENGGPAEDVSIAGEIDTPVPEPVVTASPAIQPAATTNHRLWLVLIALLAVFVVLYLLA